MIEKATKILLVDDDELNRDVLMVCLQDEPYELVQAQNGEEALQILRQDPDGFHAIVLDRLMPVMTGLEVMAQLKADDRLKWIPVIMQTSAGAAHEICEGMEAGVFFYLAKPYDQVLLLRIVKAAVEEGIKWRQVRESLYAQSLPLTYLQNARFHIRTIESAYDLAIMIAQACPDPEKIAFGLNELIVNGVEHGNLGIRYEEKSGLQASGQWEEEINRRMVLPENIQKFVEVTFERCQDGLHVTIKDQGEGFDWREYEFISPSRVLESHGRGIAMTKALSFDRLEYQGTGNQVLCVIHMSEPECQGLTSPSFDCVQSNSS